MGLYSCSCGRCWLQRRQKACTCPRDSKLHILRNKKANVCFFIAWFTDHVANRLGCLPTEYETCLLVGIFWLLTRKEKCGWPEQQPSICRILQVLWPSLQHPVKRISSGTVFLSWELRSGSPCCVGNSQPAK